MPFSRQTRNLTVWLLCAFLMAGALLPSLSHAIALAVGTRDAEICTSTGIARPQLADTRQERLGDAGDEGDAGDDGEQPGDACRWCLAHSACKTLPPRFDTGLRVAAPTAEAPASLLLRPAARAHRLWGTRSRAPPS